MNKKPRKLPEWMLNLSPNKKPKTTPEKNRNNVITNYFSPTKSGESAKSSEKNKCLAVNNSEPVKDKRVRKEIIKGKFLNLNVEKSLFHFI